MKKNFGLALGLVLSAFVSHASLRVQVQDCAQNFGPNLNNLAAQVDTLDDNYTKLGYNIIDVFMELRTPNCRTLSYNNGQVSCNGTVIGRVENLRVGDYGAPTGKLILASNVRAEIKGSCDPRKRNPLQIEFSR